MILVYEYGLLPPTVGGDVVSDQMRKAHAHFNALIALERERREEFLAFEAGLGDLSALDQERAEVRSAIEDRRARIKGLRSTQGSKDGIALLKEEVAALLQRSKEIAAGRKEIRQLRATGPAAVAYKAAEKERMDARKNLARRTSGLYWGTYLLIEDAARRSSRCKGKPPRFRRWAERERHSVGVHIQGGAKGSVLRLLAEPPPASVANLVTIAPVASAAFDPALEPSRGARQRLQRTTLRMRVGPVDDPVIAEWPMILHRPLPADASICGVRVNCERHANWRRWTVQFILQRPDPAPRPAGRTVALDLGWRQSSHEAPLRVAYWADDAGRHGAIEAPRSSVERMEKAESIRACRDRDLNALKEALVPLLMGLRPADEWLRGWLPHVGRSRAFGKFARLVLDPALRSELPSDSLPLLDAWHRRDRHLWQYEVGMRKGALHHRRDAFRVLAADLVRRYARIVIEDFDLRAFSDRGGTRPERKRDQEPSDARRENRASNRRVKASPSEFRAVLVNTAEREGTCVVRVPCPCTTRHCSFCGHTDPWDDPAALVHLCPGCGRAYDQDWNATRNLLRLSSAASGAPPETPAALAAPNASAIVADVHDHAAVDVAM